MAVKVSPQMNSEVLEGDPQPKLEGLNWQLCLVSKKFGGPLLQAATLNIRNKRKGTAIYLSVKIQANWKSMDLNI